MPLYEYKCEQGHRFDAMQSFSDDPLTKCEICGAPAARVLSAPAIHFKGSGFYNTDYGTRRRAREKESAGSSEASSSGSDSGSSGSDSSSSSSSSDSATSSTTSAASGD